MKLQSIVNRQITAGVLIGGICVACLMWFLAYNQQKLEAFNTYTAYSQY